MAEAHQHGTDTVGEDPSSSPPPNSSRASDSDHGRKRKRKRSRSEYSEPHNPQAQANDEEPPAHHDPDATFDPITDDAVIPKDQKNDTLVRKAMACINQISKDNIFVERKVKSAVESLAML